MSTPVPDALVSLNRRLWLYRGLVVVLSLSLLGVLGAVRRAMATAADPDVEVFDVPARFEALARHNPSAADVSETYFYGDSATVHLHAMGKGQTCPLHIHRGTHEATVIAAGQALVRQVWGHEDALIELRSPRRPGELIGSPPFTGHEWRNPSAEQFLGNLVFATPHFDGNLYVDADDARMKQGREPFAFDPDAALAALRASGEASREEPLPVLDGHMSSLLLERGEHALTATPEQPVVLYVARGTGTLTAPEARPVKAGQLWVLRRAAQVRAEANGGLVLYVFRPPSGASR
ncbi:hypothetical protein DRW03_22620 [Corallococcus sp. H22C18031201]|nr:hypothetical protein DRW03_22620 [Corallococcus sp. H22C18031201]